MVVHNVNKSWCVDDYNCCSFAFNTKTGFDYPDIGLVYGEYNYEDDNEYSSSWVDFAEDIIYNEFPYKKGQLGRRAKADFIADVSAEALLRERRHIREIESEDELRDDEELVEFAVEIWPLDLKFGTYMEEDDRIQSYYELQNDVDHEMNQPDYFEMDYDFHFKVLRNGEWVHKVGGSEIGKTYSWRDTSPAAIYHNFSGMAYGIYDSKVILFASKVAMDDDKE